MNARDATTGAVEGLREIVVRSYQPEPGLVAVAVRDSGVGIDPARIEQIFQPFFTTKSGGMGMGLAISRSAVEAHGGKVWVESELEKGTSIYIQLPASTEKNGKPHKT